MSNQNIETAAKRLREAAQKKQPCAPVRDLIGETDLEKAYAVQSLNTAWRKARGGRVVGSKIGLTSPAVQKQLGVSQPDFGMLWGDTEVSNNGEISARAIMQPKVEAEIAFVLGKDLPDPSLTTTDVLSAIEYALASIEIVGSRIENWDIRITDTIADNASASHFVVGHKPVRLENLDLIHAKMCLYKNGEKASEGRGDQCMGSPLNAMLWLAKTLAKLGTPMKAGDLILTGALGPMVPVAAGDAFEARIEGLGGVFVRFTD
ncbi:MAG: 2-keto-4-pentenoate hydratase [Bacteroidetes bacterium]|nr:MAG: 2-keto-4-pentenoate hydratase [Bacteroidota bacterium]